jgi:hypothetical protein
MSDRSGLPTCEASPFAVAEPADFSLSSPGAASDYRPASHAPISPKRAALDHSDLARRMRDNLNWALAFDPRASPFPPTDVWPEIKALWPKSDEEFVTGLYDVLLGRPPDPSGLETFCASLAAGAPRVALVRTMALSDEAVVSQLDLSWLPYLDEVEAEAVWKKMQSLWGEPDRMFVAGLYPLLLVRPPEWMGVAAHCRAMKAGTSRACVVRAIALSDEAQVRGLCVSWLPRLETLPTAQPRPPLLSFGWLKAAFRRWRNSGAYPNTAETAVAQEATLQPFGAAVEGGRL